MDILDRLSLSKFRSSFHLNSKMKLYVKDKGIDKIKNDTYDLINKRLRPKYIENDGKQTPMRQVHPTFIAQHATATCCRSCLYKWHRIEEVDYIVDIIIKWIEKEVYYGK